MIAAPHTSNWDFPFTLFSFWLLEINVKYFIKDQYTKSIFGFLFKWTGAIGVDRSKKNNLVQHCISLLNQNKELVILVPAEGTRSRVEKWRKGFYQIALNAHVPVCLGFLDFENKKAGVGKVLNLTGNFEHDMQIIEDFYKDIKGKNPKNYNKKIY